MANTKSRKTVRPRLRPTCAPASRVASCGTRLGTKQEVGYKTPTIAPADPLRPFLVRLGMSIELLSPIDPQIKRFPSKSTDFKSITRFEFRVAQPA
jgi:hypothetical protein